MNRKILELNLYGQSQYIDLNLVSVIEPIKKINCEYANAARLHAGFSITFNISAPFSTNNTYTAYFVYGGEWLDDGKYYPHKYSSKKEQADILFNKVTEIRNQIVDIWSGKISGDYFVIKLCKESQLSEKENTNDHQEIQ